MLYEQFYYFTFLVDECIRSEINSWKNIRATELI